MNVEDLVKKYGGKPVDEPAPVVNADELARKFGGAPIEQKQIDPDALAKQFGGYVVGAETPEEDSSDFMRGLKNFLPQIQETIGGARVLAGKAFGSKDMIKSGAEQMKAGQAEQKSKESDEFTAAWEKGIGTVLTDWLPYQMGAGVGSLAETLASMGLGAAAGAGVGSIPGAVTGAIGKKLLKKEIKEKAEQVLKEEGQEEMERYLQKEAKKALRSMGANAGIAAQAGVHGAGEVTSRAVGELENKGMTAEDLDLGRVAPAAIVHAVADFVSDKIAVGALKGLTGASSKNLVLDVAKAVAITGTKELPPEVVQTIAERYGAQLSLTDAQALIEYVNTGAAAYGMSVVPGGVGGVRTYYADKAEDKAKKKQDAADNKAEDKADNKAFFDGMNKPALQDSAATVDSELEAALRPATLDDEQAPGETSAVPTPAPAPTDEVSVLQEKINALTAEIRERQQKIESGTHNNPAAARDTQNRQLEELFNLQEQLLAAAQPPATPAAPTPATPAAPTPVTPAAPIPATPGAQPPAGGAPDVSGQAEQGTAGAGVPVSSEPGAGGAATVAPTIKLDRVDSGEKLAGELAGREETPPTAVTTPTPTPTAVTEPTTRRVEIQEPKGPPSIIPYSQGALDYLNLPSYYGGEAALEAKVAKRREELEQQGATKAQIDNELKQLREELRPDLPVPNTPEQGIKFSAAEQAFDDFDTVAYEEGVLPELTRLAAERNEAEGTDKYVPGRPLDFMTEQQLVDLYKQKVGERPLKEGGKDRQTQAANRQEFLQTLDPEERAQFEERYNRTFRNEVITDATHRERNRKPVPLTEKEEQRRATMQELQAKTERGIEADKAKQEQAVKEEIKQKLAGPASDAKQERREAATADRVARAAEARERALERGKGGPVERAIREGKSVIDILKAIAESYKHDLVGSVVANGLLKLVKGLNLDVKIQFGTLPQIEDGRFDPSTNTITLQGENGRYVGNRRLVEAVLHEVAHYLTDHVVENSAAYLASIKDTAKRAEVQAALNRLGNNFRLAKTKLGSQFNIPTMKEFIAQAFSDPKFQEALAALPTEAGAKKPGGLFARFAQNVAYALGFMKGEGASLQNVLQDIAQIISLPTAETRATEVSRATTVQKEEEKGPDFRGGGLGENLKDYETKETARPKTLKFLVDMFRSTEPWKVIAHYFQSDRYFARAWEQAMDMAGKIKYDIENGVNNVYTQITLSTGKAKNYYNGMVKPLHEKLNSQVNVLAEALGKDVRTTIQILHQLMEALHEPERRRVKYIMTVPLSTQKNLNGGKLSAADRREEIMKLLDSKRLTEPQAQQLRAELDKLVQKYTDPFGYSPRGIALRTGQTYTAEQIAAVTDENNAMYNVLGVERDAINKRLEQYNNHPKKAEFDAVLNTLRELNDVTEELSKISNYWSDFVSNRVAFYGFKNYAPFKGKAEFDKHSEVDEYMDFDDRRMGAELQEAAFSFDGRISIADNPVLQTVSDAVRASLRAGRKDLTLSIKNAVQQKLIKGKIIKTIKFEDRNDSELLKSLKGGKNIFHYNPDGTIDIIRIDDKPLLESIRRTYKDTNSLVDIANAITSTFGKMHTRWNYNFPPLNFVRDAITNAWAMGAEFGPAAAARMASNISARMTVGNALYKAGNVARLYEKGDFDELVKLAEKDPIVRDMIEYLQEGGMVSYLSGLSIKSNFDELMKSVGRSGVLGTVDQVNKFLDIYINMFELASRSCAYAVVKQEYLSQGKPEAEARTRTAAYVKNLANFEQVGVWGKNLGAFYMFLRPAATGAVRAIEAAAPAIPGSMERAELGLPSEIYNSPEALETWRQSYQQQQKYSRIMLASLVGVGYVTYVLASMLAPDDDLGRNEVLNDNMEQWTRFARFHIPKEWFGGKEDQVIQMPWGFGLGAFAAAGAQIASVSYGKESLSNALSNIVMQISFDSFLPIPVSRMKFQDNPLGYAVDSIMPSFIRPMVEFLMNKNGLGQNIYNDANRRMGDAYLGGDKIPEIYKDAAANLAEYSGMFGEMGQFDFSPNSLYFFSNSYADGIGRVIELAYGTVDLARGAKEFNPKNDIPLIGSFFGSKSSIDSRQFAEAEKKIKELERRVNLFEANPEQNAKYQVLYPLHSAVVDYYNKEYTSQLKALQSEAKNLRLDRDMLPKDRSEALRMNKALQDMAKNNMMENFKMYGVMD